MVLRSVKALQILLTLQTLVEINITRRFPVENNIHKITKLKKVILVGFEHNGMEELLDLYGDNIQVLFGYFRRAMNAYSTMKGSVHEWKLFLIKTQNASISQKRSEVHWRTC